MGGEILVGIRRRDGSEQVQEVWTNPLPFVLNDPTFYSDARRVERWMRGLKPGRSSPRIVRRVGPSEYGVILIDFVDRCLLSRNVYSQPGELYVITGPRSDEPERKQLVRKMHKRKLVTKVERFGTKEREVVPDTDIWIERFLADDLAADPTHEDGMYFVHWRPARWTFDDGERAIKVWPEVRAWLKQHGWKTPAEVNPRRWDLE